MNCPMCKTECEEHAELRGKIGTAKEFTDELKLLKEKYYAKGLNFALAISYVVAIKEGQNYMGDGYLLSSPAIPSFFTCHNKNINRAMTRMKTEAFKLSDYYIQPLDDWTKLSYEDFKVL